MVVCPHQSIAGCPFQVSINSCCVLLVADRRTATPMPASPSSSALAFHIICWMLPSDEQEMNPIGHRLRPRDSITPFVAALCVTSNPRTLLPRQPGGAPTKAPSSSRIVEGPILAFDVADAALHWRSTRRGCVVEGTDQEPKRSIP